MKTLVIGAGVAGVTTAWELNQRGYEVTVVDALDSAAMETSYANAGQRSYGHVAPWAAPDVIGVGLRGLFSRQGPLKVHFPPHPSTIGFLARTLRYATTPRLYESNNTAMLKLGMVSREAFLALEKQLDLSFDGDHKGLLEVTSDPDEAKGLRNKAHALSQLGIHHEWLEASAISRQEPGLQCPKPLQSSLLINGDGTGDCHRFTRELMAHCESVGVQFQFNTQLVGWERSGNRITGAELSSGDAQTARTWTETADRVVLCAGCGSRQIARKLGLSLPVYPVKGYSLTAQVTDPERAPRSTVVDLDRKVAITRLGERMRVTGFAELAAFDRRLPQTRLDVIREAVESRFPGAADFQTAEPWTGFRPMLPDGPPALGKGPIENLFVNTGHGTFGWTLSAGSARILGQVMDEETPPISLKAFDPQRF